MGADVLLQHEPILDAAGAVGVRMTPTEGAVKCVIRRRNLAVTIKLQ